MPSFLSQRGIEHEITRVINDRWAKSFRAGRRMGTLARLSITPIYKVCNSVLQSLLVFTRRTDNALGQECPSYDIRFDEA